MIPRFRAWLKEDKEMIDVDEMHFKMVSLILSEMV